MNLSIILINFLNILNVQLRPTVILVNKLFSVPSKTIEVKRVFLGLTNMIMKLRYY